MLRRIGLHDWLSSEHPETNSCVEMAAEAFIYLAVEHDPGATPLVLSGAFAFLEAEGYQYPSEGAMRDLAALLAERPVDLDGIRYWFADVFP